MSWLYLALIVFLPFSPFLFQASLDLWEAALIYFQVLTAFILAYSFFENQKQIKISNLPLTLLISYLVINTSFFWGAGLSLKEFRFGLVQPCFNFLCFAVFYKCAFQLNRDQIYRIVKIFSYAICVYLFYCVLQYFDLDQFFIVFKKENTSVTRVVGLLGNEGQNAIYLALCLPLFYLRKDRFSIFCACLIWMLLAVTISGVAVITAIAVTIFFSCFYRLPKWYYAYILAGIIGLTWLKFPELQGYFNPHGRIDIWIKLWPTIKELPILGWGLGTMNALSRTKQFWWWRHLHNEYYQIWLETGFIGLIAVLYCIWEYFRGMLRDRLSITLASIFFGFCIVSLGYYPAHIALLAMPAMMAYSFQYVLKNEGITNVKHTF